MPLKTAMTQERKLRSFNSGEEKEEIAEKFNSNASVGYSIMRVRVIEKIKSAHLGISITDISKKADKIWKGMSKEKKQEWDCKAEDTRREYEKTMKEYKVGQSESSKREKSKKKNKAKDGTEINTL
ncbi:hypothetical protein HPG69_006664 [Diceros bicornis minor]|uniref:HMG box domain-containing protein n=1 Tax=Diceros bicornis minor TaxID=77932 RepID=A0A7J7F631_DICBM|nr:hypothetical protein HPG69_006664 [Diceros bicornis minor]